jgi:hypothetical protein
MTPSNADPVPGMPDSAIPVLSTLVPEADVPPALRLVLDARAREKAAFAALSDDLIQALRPEMERLVTDMVRTTCQQLWQKRTRIDG